jgi:hypothetical protein
MVNSYQQLWTDAAKTNDEAKVVQILTEILTDKEGRSFILNLDRKKAKLCIEILDRVSCDFRLLPFPSVSDGFTRALRTTTSKWWRDSDSSLL